MLLSQDCLQKLIGMSHGTEGLCLRICFSAGRIAEIGRQFNRTLSHTGKGCNPLPAMRREGIMYYDDCQLVHYPKRVDWDKPESYFLVLNGRREPSKDYRFDPGMMQ